LDPVQLAVPEITGSAHDISGENSRAQSWDCPAEIPATTGMGIAESYEAWAISSNSDQPGSAKSTIEKLQSPLPPASQTVEAPFAPTADHIEKAQTLTSLFSANAIIHEETQEHSTAVSETEAAHGGTNSDFSGRKGRAPNRTGPDT